MWKKVLLIGSILLFLSGCTMQTNSREKIRDLEYTIVEQRQVPEELKQILEEKKAEEFKLTYEEEEERYLCIGYGEQKTHGYSIAVKELYESENAVYFDTALIGPEKGEEAIQTPSYPCLVVRTELVDKPVVFQ